MTKQTKTIVEIADPLEMVGFIKANGTQCRFVSMVSETVVTKLKASCPYKGVIKISRKRGMINMNYNRAVCKGVAEKLGVELNEVEYTNGAVWYKHMQTVDGKALPLVIHATKETGKHYLQYFPTASDNVYKLPNGEIIDEALLKPYFYADNRPDYKPCVIAVDVSNIKQLRASGVIMQTSDIAEAEALLSAE